MRQRGGVIFEALYYDVVCMSSTSTYEADAVILALMCFLFIQVNLILVPFPAHCKQVTSL